MINNTSLAHECMQLLCEHVGIVNTEKFLVMVKSDAFDYTEWQRDHYDKIPDKELRQNMIEFCKAHPFKGKLIHDDE